jgi:UDP-N-acetylmuramoylalanine--D-glutamate ligase
MGLGSFGGGAGAVRHLAAQGRRVVISDTRSEQELAGSLAPLRPLIQSGTVSLRLGPHDPADLRGAELLVANPAVKHPWDHPFIAAARDSGVRITTEIALALDALPPGVRIHGVTGSAGKSTTSAMIHAGLRAAGVDARLGGNIGGSVLDSLGAIAQGSTLVLELSSAMLWWLDQPGARLASALPEIGVVTNLTPNHLDWHLTPEHYERSKRVLIERLPAHGAAVLGHSLAWDAPPGVRVVRPGPAAALPPIALPGGHNRINAALALAACAAAGAAQAEAVDGIAAFTGLPHRLRLVREHRGVRWYNDSKSTTPEATALALDAFPESPAHLIVGGSDKGVDLAPIAGLRNRVRSLLCIGQTGERIAAMAGVRPARTLDRAVELAEAAARPGDVVLLSPGCASFDQFRSFEHRGEAFEALVGALP